MKKETFLIFKCAKIMLHVLYCSVVNKNIVVKTRNLLLREINFKTIVPLAQIFEMVMCE